MHHGILERMASIKDSFLYAAAKGGRVEECASLLSANSLMPNSAGANFEWRHDDEEDNALLAAVRNGHSDVAALLLAHGANPSVLDSQGNTVIHLSAFIGDEGLASLFSPNASTLAMRTNNLGMTAIDIAVDKGYNAFAEHLNNLIHESNSYDEHETEEDDQHESEEGDDNGDDDDDDDDDESSASRGVGREGVGRDAGVEEEETEDSNSDHSSLAPDDDINEAFVSSRIHAINAAITTESIYDEMTSQIHTPPGGGESLAAADDETGNDLPIVINRNHFEDEYIPADDELLSSQINYGTLLALAHSKSMELYKSKYALNEVIQERDQLKNKFAIFLTTEDCGGVDILSHKSLAELNELEEQVKRALSCIVKAREVASSNLEDARMCVICKEKPKCVLYMPCRHLCACQDCGHSNRLVQCPLCRQNILERINVYND